MHTHPPHLVHPPAAAQVNFDNDRFREYIMRADALTAGVKQQLVAAGVKGGPAAEPLPWCAAHASMHGAACLHAWGGMCACMCACGTCSLHAACAGPRLPFTPLHTHTHRFDEHHPVNFTLASALGTATPDVAALEAFAPKVRSAPPLRSSL